MKRRRNRSCKKNIAPLAMAVLCAMLLPLPVQAAPGYDQVAESSTTSEELGADEMTSVYGSSIADGTYEVSVDSSSTFFKVLSAELTVKDGQMRAVLSMYSNSYTYVYQGTGEEAAKAAMEDYIPLEKGEEESTFTISVEALNQEMDLASFSKKKKKWYDRKILINAADLPQEALSSPLPDEGTNGESAADEDTEGDGAAEEADANASGKDVPEAVTLEKKDGTYSIEVTLAGGSGRASVTSPTWLYVREGKAYARLLWSSTYYDYMIVGGETYKNETTDGSNSTFTIPVTALDQPMKVIADTTAMGDPLEIEYTLTFYEESVDGVGQIPQEAAKKVLIFALILIVAGGILNYIVKRRRYR